MQIKNKVWCSCECEGRGEQKTEADPEFPVG